MPDTARSDHRSALIAGYLGWTLDAFDFFLVVSCLTAIGREFPFTGDLGEFYGSEPAAHFWLLLAVMLAGVLWALFPLRRESNA